MNTQTRRLPFALALLLAAGLAIPRFAAAAGEPAPLSPEESRGKRLFLAGESGTGGEITAVMGSGGPESAVPGVTLPCGSCHGRDGRGRPEGGIAPSNITWDSLTKPYGSGALLGRTHPPYDEKSVKRAVTLGFDPAGNPLNPTMPRYRMSQADIANLVAYLKRVGNEPIPGVSATTVRLGALLAPGEPGGVTRALLDASVAEVNQRGGLYGRKLELAAETLTGNAADRARIAADFLDRIPVLALVAPDLSGAPGSDRALADLLEEREVPAVGAISLFPPADADLDRETFYLLASPADQARALVETLAKETVRPAFALVASDAAEISPLADAVVAEAERRGYAPTVIRRYSAAGGPNDPWVEVAARDFAAKNVTAIIHLGPARDASALLLALDRLGSRPRLLALGAYADRALLDLPTALAEGVRLAFPVRPLDLKSEEAAEWRALATAHRLTSGDLGTQGAALAAIKLMVAALEKIGRDLTRDHLIATLETFERYDTGVSPPLRFRPGKRMGARGAYLVKLDVVTKGFVPEGDWIDLD
ncbi:MAG TPA: ABC transporter substrate-binding protein [Thermoanaerobaculia bacterium]|jgi:ABC-type branched-subunit amino acid transport system substrate-binding protein|nr:ABC transporter substrate-binding protein [Thermoanaerobaculia bacterium]